MLATMFTSNTVQTCSQMRQSARQLQYKAQYQSHTSDTIAYIKDYWNRFLKLKSVFLEFQVTKRTQAKVYK